MHELARGRDGRRGGGEASMRDEIVFGVRILDTTQIGRRIALFFRRRCNHLRFQRITTAKLNALLANAFGV